MSSVYRIESLCPMSGITVRFYCCLCPRVPYTFFSNLHRPSSMTSIQIHVSWVFSVCRGRIQRKNCAWDPMPEWIMTSSYVDSKVDSNTCTMGNPKSELTLTLRQSQLCPPVSDVGLASVHHHILLFRVSWPNVQNCPMSMHAGYTVPCSRSKKWPTRILQFFQSCPPSDQDLAGLYCLGIGRLLYIAPSSILLVHW